VLQNVEMQLVITYLIMLWFKKLHISKTPLYMPQIGKETLILWAFRMYETTNACKVPDLLKIQCS
jgi:hypothetical protein